MRTDQLKRLKLITLAVMLLLAVAVACRREEPPKPPEPPKPATPPAQPAAQGAAIVDAAETPVTLTKNPFDHNRPEHQKQDCTLCHKRVREQKAEGGSPVPTEPAFPPHEACDRCHSVDFNPTEQTRSNLCVVCHGPDRPVALMPQTQFIDFRNQLRQFGIRAAGQGMKGFSHDQHMKKLPAGATALKCESCHTIEGRGVNVSMPSHPQCYTCHEHQAGQKFGECKVCHATAGKEPVLQFKRRVDAAFNLYNFKHSSHRPAAIKADCARCHRLLESPPGENRSDILQISTARGQKHKSACWSCHVQARETRCTKCHLGGPPAF